MYVAATVITRLEIVKSVDEGFIIFIIRVSLL